VFKITPHLSQTTVLKIYLILWCGSLPSMCEWGEKMRKMQNHQNYNNYNSERKIIFNRKTVKK